MKERFCTSGMLRSMPTHRVTIRDPVHEVRE